MTDETQYATFEDLTQPYDDDIERTVELSGGRKVRVRGLSRFEWFLCGKGTENDGNAFEENMLMMGMEQPPMSVTRVRAWRKLPGANNDIGAVSDRIRKLTGIGEGADKSDV